jgi:ketosteroid isomerase-like protein
MSQENVEIVRALFASDAPLTPVPQLSPDAEFDFTSLYPDQPVLRGVEEMRAFRDTGPWGSSISFAPERFIDVDDERVLVLVRATAAGTQSGTPVVAEVAHELTLRDGLVVRVKVHPGRSEALKAVGLGE